MELGEVYITRGIDIAIQESPVFEMEVWQSFLRYLHHDWGDLCGDDIILNTEALKAGERILALYKTSRGDIYIITEWDRSVTTILFIDEY